MIPLESFTPAPVVRAFIDPYGRPYDPAIGWSPGGINLNNGAQGREVQLWYATFNATHILIHKEFGGLQSSIAIPGVQAVSLAFDSNMQPTLAYKDAGGQRLRFFDAAVSDFTTITQAAATSGLVALDDIRDANSENSDVIWGYTRDGNLYYRVQRERYITERLVGPVRGPLINMGPTDERRLMFRCKPT